jgi:hypothetical protein
MTFFHICCRTFRLKGRGAKPNGLDIRTNLVDTSCGKKARWRPHRHATIIMNMMLVHKNMACDSLKDRISKKTSDSITIPNEQGGVPGQTLGSVPRQRCKQAYVHCITNFNSVGLLNAVC